MPIVDDIAGLRRILPRSRTLAVVGLSAQLVPAELFRGEVHAGPRLSDHPGQSAATPRCWASGAIPTLAVDSRAGRHRRLLPQAGGDVPHRATRRSPTARRCCGCSSASATTRRRDRASAAGLDVVMDRCVKIEHARILGGLNWAGVNTGVISSRRPAPARMDPDAHARPPFGFDTLCLHAGQIPDAATGARALPIYQTTSFVFDSADHAASLFNLQTFGNVYSRISNPTVAALEERVAALEGGRAALAAATGMAAQMLRAPHAAPQRRPHRRVAHAVRRHVLAARRHVRAVRHRHDVRRRRRSGELPPRAASQHQGALRRRRSATRSSTSPTSRRSPTIAHAAGVPLVVDNTLASPYLCRPFEHGADIVVHSVTKYLGGHGTTMGGVLVESGKFPWDNGNFPQMTEPSRGYHGVRFYETFGDFGFTMKARMETMRTLGPTLSPLSAFLLLQGIETLHLRMPRHCESALAVAAAPGARIRRSSGSTIRCCRAIRGRALRATTCRAAPAASSRSASRAAPRPACASSRPCSSCRTSPTSATRRRWSSIRRRRRTASWTRTSSAPPACRPR